MKGTVVQHLVPSLHSRKVLGLDPLGAPVSPPRGIQGQVNWLL